MRDILGIDRKTILQTLILVAAASVAASGVHAFRTRQPPWKIDPLAAELTIEPIGPAELQRYLQAGKAVWVDTRNADEFETGHIAGAVNIPARRGQENVERIFELLSPEDFIVLYCRQPQCPENRRVGDLLMQNGFPARQLRRFNPGWEGVQDMPDIPKVGQAYESKVPRHPGFRLQRKAGKTISGGSEAHA